MARTDLLLGDEAGNFAIKKKKKVTPLTVAKVASPNIPTIPTLPAPNATVQPRDLDVRPFTAKDPGTFEEGVAQRAAEQNKVVPEEKAITGTEVAPEQGPTSGDVKGQLAAVARQRKLAQFKNAFDVATGVEQRNLEALPGEFRGLQTQVRTEGDLAKAGAGKIAAIGATGAGSLAQTNLGQDVITRGQSGALLQQEQQAKTDIKNRLADLQREFETGVADVNMQAESDNLALQLEQITAQEQAELKALEIQDARDYDLFIRELDKFDEQEMAIFENTLQTENTLLDEQIQIAQDERDFKMARDLQGQKDANAIKLQAAKDSAAAARITDKGIQDRATAEFKTGLEAEEQATVIGDRFDDNVFEDGSKSLLNNFDQYTDQTVKTAALTDYLFGQISAGNITTDEQIVRLEAKFNLEPGAINKKLEEIEKRENNIPGAGGLGLPN